ncbi:MAG: bifunctional isocitrate dehydrogenase kinase/phosphatase [Acidobacteriota bacterium]
MRESAETLVAHRGARAISHAYLRYRAAFDEITGRASGRFESRDWGGLQHDARERLELYSHAVDDVVGVTRAILGPGISEHAVWTGMKREYSRACAGRADLEIAETFFNSVTRRIFSTVGVDAEIEFVDSDFELLPSSGQTTLTRHYHADGDLRELVLAALAELPLESQLADLSADASRCADAIHEQVLSPRRPFGAPISLELLSPIFFRGRRAFVVGSLRGSDGTVPLLIALTNPGAGLRVDAVLTSEDEVSIVFSFTRSYFHVAADRPRELIDFLRAIMPRKPLAELYTAIGFHKHGKTELYRSILHHLRTTSDAFEPARGEPGLVMLVFTLRSYDVVLKVIRDYAGYPKTTTRQDVLDRYRLVFNRDRAGRLVDAQSFEHLRFDRSRFTAPLLDSLLRDASRTVELDGNDVVIHHLFTERRVTPLNLYLREAPEAAARQAVLDFGQAIKDLAAANIFPGDMLLKNFGVTRHGRVVFYDYDELCLLTDLRFRRIPPSRFDDDETAAEPWFSVAENDIFPEEFPRFLGLSQVLRETLMERHRDLFEPEFWQALQRRHHAGESPEELPYPAERRLPTSR